MKGYDPTGLTGPSSSSYYNVKPAVMYRCFDAEGDLLYVGCTVDLFKRIGEHAHKPWFADVAEMRSEPFPTWWQAFHAEQTAIDAEGPRHNTTYSQSAGKGHATRARQAAS